MRLVYLLFAGGSPGTAIPQNTPHLNASAEIALRFPRENSGTEKC